MPITFRCPSCNAAVRVSRRFAGRRGTCPRCHGKITVPDIERPAGARASSSEQPVWALLEDIGEMSTGKIVEEESEEGRVAPPSGPVLRWTVVGGARPGQVFVLENGVSVVGRSSDCKVVVHGDPTVSRRHCEVRVEFPRAFLRDLGTPLGTQVNEIRLAGERELANGDEIRIGESTRIRHEVPPENVPPPPLEVELPGFRVLSRIGGGGMGTVYRAVDAEGQVVALKTIRRDQLSDPTAVATFVREMRAASCVVHPNVVRFLEAHASAEQVYFSMELVDGPDLHAHLSRELGCPLALGAALAILGQLLDAVECAHGHRIVHRDVKPSNVLLASRPPSSYCIKLGDFGIARSLEVTGLTMLTKTGQARGTPGFMAPEQVEDAKRVGPAADIYSVGATIYFALTLRHPIDLTGRWLSAILRDDPRPIQQLRPDIPAAISGAIMQCLERDPSRRPRSVAELRRLLPLR